MLRKLALLFLFSVTCQFSLADQAFDDAMAKAKSGNARAQYNVGLKYESGEGVAQDHTQAANWFSKAAEQGYAEAQYNLGLKYEKGEGVTKNYQQAVKWYTRAAEQDYTDAQYNLGLLYARGEGVKRDDQQAYAWFSVAAIDGAEDAANNKKIVAARLAPQELAAANKLAVELVRKIEKKKAVRQKP